MTVPEFEMFYHKLDSATLCIYRKSGHKALIKKDNRYDIDIKFLIRRRDFCIKIWNKAHENYYSIIEHISQRKLAILLNRFYKRSTNSWDAFMRDTLFSPVMHEKSLMKYEINFNLWAFFRITTVLIRRLSR